MLSAAFVGLVLAAEPCEAPRVHDVAPLTAAIAQDKAMAQGFLLAAGACAGAEWRVRVSILLRLVSYRQC